MAFGSGAYTYELADGWGKLPAGYEWNQVAGVETDEDDNVWVFNRSDHKLMIFDREGNFLKAWDETYANPHALHISKAGDVFLVDRDAHVVLKYNKDGKLLFTLGIKNKASDTGKSERYLVEKPGPPFNLPTGVAVAGNGDIFVSDGYGNCRVHKFNSTGTLLDSWGEPGKVNPFQFHLPHGIAIDNDGMVLVCDRENHRIQLFDQNGEDQGIWEGFRQPTDIAVGPDGTVYVSELGHRLSILDKNGKLQARWGGESSHDAGQFVAPHGIAIDSHGDLYVGEVLEGRRLQKFIHKN
jgi:DNA-binding beta-propeller fold protein YncE